MRLPEPCEHRRSGRMFTKPGCCTPNSGSYEESVISVYYAFTSEPLQASSSFNRVSGFISTFISSPKEFSGSNGVVNSLIGCPNNIGTLTSIIKAKVSDETRPTCYSRNVQPTLTPEPPTICRFHRGRWHRIQSQDFCGLTRAGTPHHHRGERLGQRRSTVNG